MFRSYAVACLVPFVVSCSGTIGEPSGDPSGDRTEPPRPERHGLNLEPAGLRALTHSQYRASVRDVLGVDLAEASAIPEVGSWGSSVGARTGVASPLLLERYENAAFDVAAWAVEPARRGRIFSCEPTGGADACLERLLDTIARRAYRRALEPDERETWRSLARDVAAASDEPWSAIEHVLAGLLQSTNFLYRLELPVPGDGTERPYDDHAVATRLAYLIWASTPDDALIDAAERGELRTDAQIAAQVERLLADPRSAEGFRSFVDELFATHELVSEVSRTSPALPEFDAEREAIRASFLDTAELMETHDGMAGLLSSRWLRARPGTAEYIGLSGEGAVEGELGHELRRAGLLTMPAFLATHSGQHAPSPTKRGYFIRERILCEVIPPPPPGVETTLPENVTSGPSTARDRLAAHREKGSVCAGCHERMDPMGLALELFDHVGAARTHEQGLPIDPSGDLDGEPFADAVGFAEAIATHDSLLPCLAGRAFEMAAGVSVDELQPEFDAMAGERWSDVVMNIALSESFRQTRTSEEGSP